MFDWGLNTLLQVNKEFSSPRHKRNRSNHDLEINVILWQSKKLCGWIQRGTLNYPWGGLVETFLLF